LLLPASKKDGKFHPEKGHEAAQTEQKYGSNLSLTSARDRGGWLTSCPCRFTPGKETRYPFHRVSGPFWAETKNLPPPPPIGIRYPDRPARGESLHRLSCPCLYFLPFWDQTFLHETPFHVTAVNICSHYLSHYRVQVNVYFLPCKYVPKTAYNSRAQQVTNSYSYESFICPF
jgi:hypothetical protein